MKSQESIVEKLLSQSKFSSVTNLLYHQKKLLVSHNILNGEQAINELKEIGENHVAKGDYMQALADIRKLSDLKMYPDAFYDADDYEKLSLGEVKKRILEN